MEITINTKYGVTFSVGYFEDTEGGMIHECYKDGIETIEAAIRHIEYLNVARPQHDWLIICDIDNLTPQRME